MKNNLKRTWELILDDRKRTPWGKSLGLGGGVISRLFKLGTLPSDKYLTRIMRAENVSLNALFGNSDTPFVVHRTINSAETYEMLKPHIEDEEWTVHLITGADYPIIVLSTLAEDSEGFKYTPIEIICGPADHATANLLKNVKVFFKALPREEAMELATGYKGTYYLFGKTTLLNAKPISHAEVLDVFREKTTSNAKTLKRIMQLIDDTIAEEGSDLSAEDRRKLVSELYTYAVDEGLASGDISENLVNSMLRVI